MARDLEGSPSTPNVRKCDQHTWLDHAHVQDRLRSLLLAVDPALMLIGHHSEATRRMRSAEYSRLVSITRLFHRAPTHIRITYRGGGRYADMRQSVARPAVGRLDGDAQNRKPTFQSTAYS